jgi:hypothetical protein
MALKVRRPFSEEGVFMRTVVGVFPSRAEAEQVARDLQSLGISPDDLSIADGAGAENHEWSSRNIAAAGGLAFGWFAAGLIPAVAEQSPAGATGFGAAVGCIGGLVAGLVALIIRHGAPFVADSAIVTALTTMVIGAVGGGLIAGMYRMGVSHEGTPLFAEALREHGVVVAAHVDIPREQDALRVMNEHGARNVRADADAWLASGWDGGCPIEMPYPSDSSVRSHQQGR